MTSQQIIEEVIKKYGGVKGAQNRFNYSTPMSIYNWRIRGLPKSRLVDIYLETGIPIDRLKAATKIEAEQGA